MSKRQRTDSERKAIEWAIKSISATVKRESLRLTLRKDSLACIVIAHAGNRVRALIAPKHPERLTNANARICKQSEAK